jgi:hypothetical protein
MENLTVFYDSWYYLIRDNTSVAQWTLLGTVIFVITAFLFLRDKIKKSLNPIRFGSEAFLECFGGAFGFTMIIIVLLWALPVTITILSLVAVAYGLYLVMFYLAKLTIRG